MQIVFFLRGAETVLDVVLRPLDQRPERVGSPGLDKLVRVFGPGHLQHLDLEIEVFQNPDGPPAGLLSRAVVVVGDDNLARIAGDQPRLLRCQGGAQRGYGAVKTRLMQRYHIYITLCEQNISIFALFCQV